MKTAIFPGSFDPLTKGHEDIILRALPLFDRIFVALGVNAEKKTLFSTEQRLDWLKEVFRPYDGIEVIAYEGLTIDLCRKLDAGFILRGLRTSADFEFERSIGQMNKQLFSDIETVFLLTKPEYTALSSSIVREIYVNQGDITPFVPAALKLQ